MNISGLKGLLIVGALLVATPQGLDARTVDGNQSLKALNCCEEKGSSQKKSDAGQGGCDKAEGCENKSDKVSQLPGEGDSGAAGTTGGTGSSDGGADGGTGDTGGTTAKKPTPTTEATGEGGSTEEGGEAATPAGEPEPTK